MAAFICTTCGLQYPDSAEPPGHCGICEDERRQQIQIISLDGVTTGRKTVVIGKEQLELSQDKGL